LDASGEKVFVADIREGQEVDSAFLLEDLRLGQTKNGKPFVGLKLRDRTGDMEARVWDRAEEFFQKLASGDVALVQGVADSFQNKVQLKISQAKRLDISEIDPAHFQPASARNPREMLEELKALVGTLVNPHLQGLLDDILTDPVLSALLMKAPAAKRFHHAYLGGLLEHTLSVTRVASAVAAFYPFLDRDLLLAGAVLHDLGKVREFDQGLTGDYTTEGRLLGHLVIGVRLLEDKLAGRPDFPEDLALLLKHLIVSHHGENELGSPKKPKILEGLALHLLDDLDAKMNGIGDYIERHLDDKTGWTDYNRLMGRYFFRPGQVPAEATEQLEPQVAAPLARPVKPAAAEPAEEDEDPEQNRPKNNPNQLSFLGD
jgi:3'-5' exoribonuclease